VDRRLTAAEAGDRLPVRQDLVSRRRAFQRQEPPTYPGKRQAPRRQSVQRGDRAGRDDICRRQFDHGVFSPGAYHLDVVEAQIRHDLRQEGGAPGKWLDQGHGEIGTRYRKHDTGQTST
jgi:hypothetical protein